MNIGEKENKMKSWKTYELHSLCESFPKLDDDELEKLKLDIKENGLRDAITLFDGKILDGQNRYAVALALNKPPKFEEFKGRDPVAFVVSKNLARRHLSTSQRAMIAASLLTNKDAGPLVAVFTAADVSQNKAADLLSVNRDSVTKAKTVATKSKKLARMVRDGEVSLNAAAKVSRMPKKRRERLTRQGAKAVKEAATTKPLPRGGLPADAIRRQQAEKEQPEVTTLDREAKKLSPAIREAVVTLIENWYAENKSDFESPYAQPSPRQFMKRMIKELFS